MKTLYTETEFNVAKSRDRLPLECLHCHSPFLLGKNDIQQVLHGETKKTRDFCSNKCQRKHECPPVVVICDQCRNLFKKLPNQLKKTKHNFCCQSCAARYGNAHKTKGTRISKLERWLAEQLVLLFPALEFHFNRKDAINGELDIYVPSLKLAFELNGIFHYEPIYGANKLAAMQTNDHRKMLACAEHGIELCVLDVSSISYFKPTKVQKFLDIITSLIRSKLSGDLPVFQPLPSQNHVEVP